MVNTQMMDGHSIILRKVRSAREECGFIFLTIRDLPKTGKFCGLGLPMNYIMGSCSRMGKSFTTKMKKFWMIPKRILNERHEADTTEPTKALKSRGPVCIVERTFWLNRAKLPGEAVSFVRGNADLKTKGAIPNMLQTCALFVEKSFELQRQMPVGGQLVGAR